MNILAFLLGSIRGHGVEQHGDDIKEAGREAARFVFGNFADGYTEEMATILAGTQQRVLIGECVAVEEPETKRLPHRRRR